MRLCFFILATFLLFISCDNQKQEVKVIKTSTPQDLEKEINSQLDDFLTKDTVISILIPNITTLYCGLTIVF